MRCQPTPHVAVLIIPHGHSGAYNEEFSLFTSARIPGDRGLHG